MGSKWIKGGEAAWSAIKGVLPEVNRTKTGTAIGKLKVESHKLKMKGAKVKQTIFEIQQKKKKLAEDLKHKKNEKIVKKFIGEK